MKHLSRPTRSFIYLLIIALLAAYGAFAVVRYYKSNIPTYGVSSSEDFHTGNVQNSGAYATYSDKRFPLSFQYPKSWRIKTETTFNNFHAIHATSPDNKVITVYVHPSEYFALQGFRTESYVLNSAPGLKWQDSIVAVKAGEHYYTFDASQNPKAVPEFKPLLESVQWQN